MKQLKLFNKKDFDEYAFEVLSNESFLLPVKSIKGEINNLPFIKITAGISKGIKDNINYLITYNVLHRCYINPINTLEKLNNFPLLNNKLLLTLNN